MIQLVRIAPFIFKIQIRKISHMIKKYKIKIIFVSIITMFVLSFINTRFINFIFSDEALFIFLLISFLPLFQNTPEIIIKPELILLKLIKLNSLKLIYFYKALFKPIIFIIFINTLMPNTSIFNIHLFNIILLIRIAIANLTFLLFQVKHRNWCLFFACLCFFFSYSLENNFIIIGFIILEILYFLLKQQLIYERIVDIYRALQRLRLGISFDIDSFIKAQETIVKKIYKKHFYYLDRNYESPTYYLQLQLSRILADQSFYLSWYTFMIVLTVCFFLFNFNIYVTLAVLFLISFNMLSQIINPLLEKIKQGLYLKIDHTNYFQLFLIPCFIASLPISLASALMSHHYISSLMMQLLFTLFYLIKGNNKIIKYSYIGIMIGCIISFTF